MRRKLVFILLAMIVAVATLSYAMEPTQAESDAYSAAMKLYEQGTGMSMAPPAGTDPSPTPQELKAQAITAFKNFVTTYPQSELCHSAQYQIGWIYFEIGDYVSAKTELQKVIANYPTSLLVDDARYQIAFIEFTTNNYEVALAGFNGVITDYEHNENEALNHKVPFAYFMVGDCCRMMNNMTSARAKWNEVIQKFPTHSQAGRAYKRLNP